MKSNYRRALDYAWVCCPPLHLDIVHTAFVKHFDKHGTNLFEQNIFLVFGWIKNTWGAEILKGRYQYNKEVFTRQYSSITEDAPDSVCLRSTMAAPDAEIITKEFYEELFKRVENYQSGHPKGWTLDTKVLRRFLDLIDEGYTFPEISEEMGISPQKLYYYKKKLKTIINQMQSPFNGDNTKITKKITRKTFESNEQYKDYKYLPDEGCDANEYYETRTNGTDFILIREKAD